MIRSGFGPVRLPRGLRHRAMCVGVAGFLVASAVAGCSGGSTLESSSPGASPTPTAGSSLTHFGATGSMAARLSQTATLLPDGKVLIAGGCCAGTAGLATAELYDPSTAKFSPTGAMTAGRYYHTATPLPDGRVLIAGGWGLDSAELYNPATGTFSATGSMTATRYYDTATLLPGGKVLVVGGALSPDSADVYDPKAGTFSPTGSLIAARSRHTATLLSNGTVLIAGGIGTSGSSAPAELYRP